MEFVSWDDELPNRWKNKSHVPNHPPDDLEQDGPKTALHWRAPSSLEMGNTHVSRWVVRENVQHISENKIDELFTHQWQAIITALDQMNVLANFGKAKRSQFDNSDHRAILFSRYLEGCPDLLLSFLQVQKRCCCYRSNPQSSLSEFLCLLSKTFLGWTLSLNQDSGTHRLINS